jgi:hypothetical protein
MRVLRTAIPRDDGSQFVCDTIQHDGKLWLAPAWVEDPAKPYSRPARIIGMSGLKYRSMPLRGDVDFVMEQPVPDSVLHGGAHGDETTPFVILEQPDIRIQNSARAALIESS